MNDGSEQFNHLLVTPTSQNECTGVDRSLSVHGIIEVINS